MRRAKSITVGWMPMKKYKIAVLDDYQNVALESADCCTASDCCDDSLSGATQGRMGSGTHCRRCVDHSHHLRNLWWRDQIGLAYRYACGSPCPRSLLADAEPEECCWRYAILHGHSDAQRAGSHRRRAGRTFQQQPGGSQRAFQCYRSCRSHRCHLHGEHIHSFLLNFRQDLGFV